MNNAITEVKFRLNPGIGVPPPPPGPRRPSHKRRSSMFPPIQPVKPPKDRPSTVPEEEVVVTGSDSDGTSEVEARGNFAYQALLQIKSGLRNATRQVRVTSHQVAKKIGLTSDRTVDLETGSPSLFSSVDRREQTASARMDEATVEKSIDPIQPTSPQGKRSNIQNSIENAPQPITEGPQEKNTDPDKGQAKSVRAGSIHDNIAITASTLPEIQITPLPNISISDKTTNPENDNIASEALPTETQNDTSNDQSIAQLSEFQPIKLPNLSSVSEEGSAPAPKVGPLLGQEAKVEPTGTRENIKGFNEKGKQPENSGKSAAQDDGNIKGGMPSKPAPPPGPPRPRKPPGTLDEHLIKGYLWPNKPGEIPPLQLRRTLDQYYYTHLATTLDRDSDQVVYRYTSRTGEPKMFMVDQLWLWILNDGMFSN